MRQDDLEWIQYKDPMDWVITKSGLLENVFFDVRGNHDKFGVPKVGSQVDYFSKYSISAHLNHCNCSEHNPEGEITSTCVLFSELSYEPSKIPQIWDIVARDVFSVPVCNLQKNRSLHVRQANL